MYGTRRNIVRGLGCALLVATAGVAAAQGADVPYVPTPWKVVGAMLGMAQVGPDDFVIDLGSGDGRIVIAAAKKHGARGLGVDIDSALVAEAQREARRQGVSDKATFATRNLFLTDLSRATVVTMYLFPRVNLQLRPRLLKELKPGTRVVSHEFDMDEWQPDERVTVPVPDKPYGAPSSEVFLWIIPADLSGQWRWRRAASAPEEEVTLRQRFQMLEGEGRIAGRPARAAGRVRGEEVRLTLISEAEGRAVRHEFAGRVGGDAIRGTVLVPGETMKQGEWQALRTGRGIMEVSVGAPMGEHTIIAEERK